jgi:hypothetical protein
LKSIENLTGVWAEAAECRPGIADIAASTVIASEKLTLTRRALATKPVVDAMRCPFIAIRAPRGEKAAKNMPRRSARQPQILA